MQSSMTNKIPQSLLWKRLHSLAGFALVIYIIEHLLVNSQAALFIGDDGSGFIEAVNSIHRLPYLPFVELALIAFPIGIHLFWGIKYLQTATYNSFSTDGSKPALPEYSRNRAYTWQRVTAWILLVGIVAHVIHMRFIEQPSQAQIGAEKSYMVRLNFDEGLLPLAQRLNVQIYHADQIQRLKHSIFKNDKKYVEKQDSKESERKFESDYSIDSKAQSMLTEQEKKQEAQWLMALEKRVLQPHQVMAVTRDFGTAELLMVRDTFKMPIMIALYTIFVLSACYHGFNGLWTFLISWGVTLTELSQRIMLRVATGLMILVSFWGLAAIWGTYWLNLRY